ncbi:ubiquitin-conjugating protein E2 [Candidatus Magnetomorum sp. HK-1]|nr:ubiquitin-conjugating protein E2 [Candidatus Magnetomorum sp. HK-1]
MNAPNNIPKQEDTIRIIIEDTARKQYEVFLPKDAKLKDVSAEFFEDIYREPRDEQGLFQRAVAELVDPKNPDKTKRLNSEETLDDLGLWDGAILRIFPESIAGIIDEHKRVSTLVADHKNLEELRQTNPKIDFKPNTSHAPTRYTIIFLEKGISGIYKNGDPIISDKHEIEIVLDSNYPGEAPKVSWKTPIFHPNISPKTGKVCLGVLSEKYLPALGLARLVVMLFEMLQYRNYDIDSPFNEEAADWAKNKDHHKHIINLGGYEYQAPVEVLLKKLEEMSNGENRKKFTFKPIERRRPQ